SSRHRCDADDAHAQKSSAPAIRAEVRGGRDIDLTIRVAPARRTALRGRSSQARSAPFPKEGCGPAMVKELSTTGRASWITAWHCQRWSQPAGSPTMGPRANAAAVLGPDLVLEHSFCSHPGDTLGGSRPEEL